MPNPQQTPLITRETIALYKEISGNVRAEKLTPFILTAQREDVKPLIGERLYNEIVNNRTAHADLLNGGSYTYEGVVYYNDGLSMVIALYAYARYVYMGHITDTPFDMVQKVNSSSASTPIPESMKKSVFIENRKEAQGIWQSVENYLNRTEYDLFREDYGCGYEPERNSSFMNFSIIKKEC